MTDDYFSDRLDRIAALVDLYGGTDYAHAHPALVGLILLTLSIDRLAETLRTDLRELAES